MPFIKAHTFASVQDAQAAIDTINAGEGFPVSEDAVTRTYTTYQQKDGYIYIQADEVTESYLGQGILIEVTLPF